MARRMVAKESAKWRAGREGVRVALRLPSGRGGKMPHTLDNDEGVAAQGDGDVMIPPWERAALEMVEAELSLELLVDHLGSPPLLDDPDDLLLGHAAWERRESEFRWLCFTVEPLHDEPEGFLLLRLSLAMNRFDATEAESRRELSFGARSPGDAPEGGGTEFDAELFCGDDTFDLVVHVEQPETRRRLDRNRVIEPMSAQRLAEGRGISISRVCEYDISRDAVGLRSCNHVESELGLRLERAFFRNARRFSPLRVVGPVVRQVELEIDGHLLLPVRHAKAHPYLAIRDLAGGARILSLNTDGVLALLEEPRVVDDPDGYRFVFPHGVDDVARSGAPDIAIAPGRTPDEVEEPIVATLHVFGGAERTSRDGLDALPLAIAEEPERIGRERLTLLGSPEMSADDALEKLLGTMVRREVSAVRHAEHIMHSADKPSSPWANHADDLDDKVRNKRHMPTWDRARWLRDG